VLARGVAFEDFEHACGGKFRPAVVWFGEALPPEPWERAVAAVRRAEVLLVVGTSGIVQPAASLASHLAGPETFVVEINSEATPISEHADVVLRGSAAEILPLLVPKVTKS
jgi:NAD-dependent deacetylase